MCSYFLIFKAVSGALGDMFQDSFYQLFIRLQIVYRLNRMFEYFGDDSGGTSSDKQNLSRRGVAE